MKNFMVFPTILLILSALVLPQPITNTQIDSIINKVKNLPVEPATSEDIVVIDTDYGKIMIDLLEEQAPLHCMNFKKLVKAGFYNGTTFHRVIPNFVIQGGDILSRDENPSNDGTGGLGYTIPAEIILKHKRGMVGAARLPDNINPRMESSACQFYICLKDLPHLDGSYTIFGKVVTGMDVVDRIAMVKTDKMNKPIKPVIMKKVYVTIKNKTNQR